MKPFDFFDSLSSVERDAPGAKQSADSALELGSTSRLKFTP